MDCKDRQIFRTGYIHVNFFSKVFFGGWLGEVWREGGLDGKSVPFYGKMGGIRNAI